MENHRHIQGDKKGRLAFARFEEETGESFFFFFEQKFSEEEQEFKVVLVSHWLQEVVSAFLLWQGEVSLFFIFILLYYYFLSRR